ncbi:hypothetical protein K439DRAFT_419927 [Ramaria rubella]|nr:hypothetical protein K439DRAFT_419927 [Ramaria rubella]
MVVSYCASRGDTTVFGVLNIPQHRSRLIEEPSNYLTRVTWHNLSLFLQSLSPKYGGTFS